ncbi:MAG: tRNA uridine-5-carboxymethylaminomethyl(34) synthesis GTPase MnmE [Bacteroidia bacterium]|nr:tRNA uridine-5-carboxymethylaminomethyl(34) synthesis GTPase MnmE [Bacteroidia bacterium]MCZ2249682.1 tRNA uridine-5-carboxymethylaminomethyl(34) synthesis GTPase MnmE [Bacteroidia bacterium]
MINSDTIIALATPQGTGAISVIRLSGQDSIALCNRFFKGRNLEEEASHTIHYGHITDSGKILDEVMVAIFHSPKSFTTENIVEISCHGSPYIAEQIIQLFVRHGARVANPGEFTLRAFMNGRIDLTQAEAVADLISSNSQASHQVAIKQMRGGFAQDLKKLRQQLIDYVALIELELDFSEEDVEFANRDKLLSLLEDAEEKITKLIQSFSLGNVIKHGVNTVIIGRPNAGKSTLLNVLLNEERAIVSDIPGTTRDTIEEMISINGIQFRFIDTAGIRNTEDVIERKGVEKAIEKLKQSTVYIYLFDVNTLSREEFVKDINELNLLGFKGLLCGNKIDKSDENNLLIFQEELDKITDKKTGPQLLFISSQTHDNIPVLRLLLFALATSSANTENDAEIITNVRHYEALLRARMALEKAKEGLCNKISGELVAFDLREVLNHIGSITGEINNEDILSSIFSRFCIGK